MDAQQNPQPSAPGATKKDASEHIRALQQRGRLIEWRTLRPTQDEAILQDFYRYNGKEGTKHDRQDF